VSASSPLDRLPGPLPPGEALLWHGRPTAGALTRHLFRWRWVAAYFGALALWPISAALSTGAPLSEALLGLLAPLPLAVPTFALIAALGWAGARTTTYYVTDRRVILQIGVGLTKIVNIPLERIAHAEFREHADGSTDISLTVRGRIAWFALWPHVRGLRFAHPQPMLRSLPDGRLAAGVLTDALMAAAPGLRHLAPQALADAAPVPAPVELPAGGRPARDRAAPDAVPAHG
jgi:hypothetical protein